ncbi:hypothetical protein E4U58_000230, partial [Claviceps cyperi]
MSKVLMVVEYKAPHKLPLTMLTEVLANMGSMYLDENFIEDHTENQRLVVSVIIQLFAAMVKNGIRYGYIDTGEAMVILRIKEHDPFVVEYHISIPKSDAENEADADGKLRLSAVCQVLAFTIQAMKAPETTSDWLVLTNNLPKWKDARMEAKDFSSGHNGNDEADESDVVNRSYCTHECVRGLAFGTPLDKNCPNVKDHGSKHIDRQEFLRLIRDQLDGEKAHANCKPINASGHIGHLFKIHLLSHGYTLVTKAVGLCDGAPLLHEEKMYNHLRDLQGRFIPACPGHVELKWLFRGEAYDNTAFRHFLFLSYAGKPVLKALRRVDNSVVSRVLEALAQLHQRRVMHRDAAPR